jgi:hypothetical protein
MRRYRLAFFCAILLFVISVPKTVLYDFDTKAGSTYTFNVN